MIWFRQLRIAHKISLVMVLVILLLSASLGVILWTSMGYVMRKSLETKGIDIAAQLAVLSSEAIQTENLYALSELVHLMQNTNKEVRYILILDENGAIMSHTFSQGIPKKLLALHPIPAQKTEEPHLTTFTSNEGTIHDVLYPIEHGDLGYIRVGLNENTIQEVLYRKIKEVLGITIIISALAFFLTLKLTKLFTKPLEQLTSISKAIANGELPEQELTEQELVTSEDEIGQLTSTINMMTASLKKNELERQNLLNRLITAQEDERKRISRELHDETSQALTALILSMRALANQVSDQEQKSYILKVKDEASLILRKLRDMAVELRPPVLDELGLVAAMKKYIDDYQERYGIDINFQHNLVDCLPEGNVSLALYRILQECLTNVVKHAHATSVFVILQATDRLELIVKDNGIGLSQDKLVSARSENRLGLYGIQERTEILGGKMIIGAELPTWSTVIKISLPLP